MVGVQLLKKLKEVERGLIDKGVLYGSFFYIFADGELDYLKRFAERAKYEKILWSDDCEGFCFHSQKELSLLIEFLEMWKDEIKCIHKGCLK